MRLIVTYIVFILIITILLPITLTKGCDIATKDEITELGDGSKITNKIDSKKVIEIYNVTTKKVEEIEFEEYIKGVVSAEMNASFELEALKAQAVAARTFSYYRMQKYKDGHPDHPDTSLCTGIHCQAYLSKDKLREIKPEKWMYEYWPKIEQAIKETEGQILTYEGKIIEPLFHSTSGGKTENSEDYFASAEAYLRSVESPYEEESPYLNDKKIITISEFINKLESKYKDVSLSESDLKDKIQLVEKSEGGKVKKIKIDKRIVSGRDIRTLFDLRSTDFKILVHPKEQTVEIQTVGYGHGVGMSQWGANGMAEHGSKYDEILTHYYTGVKIEKIY